MWRRPALVRLGAGAGANHRARGAGGTFRNEDLVTDPEATLRKVAACVGVAFDPLMLEGARSPIMPADYRHGRFVDEKAAEYPNLPPGIEARIRPDLDRLG
jgi:hypothetical protein